MDTAGFKVGGGGELTKLPPHIFFPVDQQEMSWNVIAVQIC